MQGSYALPIMSECIESIEDSQVFSLLDVNSDYWIINDDKENREQTASTSHHGLF